MGSLIDKLWQYFFKAAYRLHLVYCFIFRPTTHGVYVAVWHGERVLLVKNSYRKCYTLPGGGRKRREDPAETGSRELHEELGLHVDPEALTFVATHLSRCEFMKDNIDLFEIRLGEEPAIRVDNREVVRADFMSVKDAMELPLFPTVGDYLRSL